MKKFRFKRLLQKSGWQNDVTVTVDSHGLVTDLGKDHLGAEKIEGLAIPGFQNAHSHAFQYAMAGLAEQHSANHSSDDFWSWREVMYQLALTISPDQLEAIAAMLYSEMVRNGYTHVAEFHYLHHDKNGRFYSHLAEHAERLISAAKSAGIKITLIPMFYQRGGFGQAPQNHQRRFVCKSIDDYIKLWDASAEVVNKHEHASIAYGIHSLRAIDPKLVSSFVGNIHFTGPFHIHIAEQQKEVTDAISFLGQRPVEWLLSNSEIDKNCHLVHATHLSDSEVLGIVNSSAHVALCPSTEGNLGDGIFPLLKYQEYGGKWSIGTDSHIGLNPCEELRWLDYGQRLTSHKRNIFGTNSGAFAIDQALTAGRAAMGNDQEEYFKVGQPFDAVIFDANQPLLNSESADNILSTAVYSSDVGWIKGTMVDGNWVVQDQQHKDLHAISKKFNNAIQELGAR